MGGMYFEPRPLWLSFYGFSEFVHANPAIIHKKWPWLYLVQPYWPIHNRLNQHCLTAYWCMYHISIAGHTSEPSEEFNANCRAGSTHHAWQSHEYSGWCNGWHKQGIPGKDNSSSLFLWVHEGWSVTSCWREYLLSHDNGPILFPNISSYI
jgi:hypothetical protein